MNKTQGTAKPTLYINGRFLTQSRTGIQKYAYVLSLELANLGYTLIFLCPQQAVDTPKFGTVKQFGRWKGHLWEQLDLPLYAKRNKLDLLINFGITAPIFCRKNLITIHDLSVFRNPNWYSLPFRMTYKFIIPRIIRKAKHITTVSEFSKSEIQSLFEVKDKTISVIYNGIYFNEVEEKKDVETPEHFILFVGSLNPRKNIQNLIKAYELIPDKELKLLIVGKPNHIYGKEEIRANSGIQFMTDIDDYQLQQLYQRAAMLVMPSYYEGFGIPVIEALYHSCPVLCSKIPVFEELYNNFVYFCNPNLPEDIAANIHDIYLSDNKLNSLGNLAEQYNFISAAKIIAQLTK